MTESTILARCPTACIWCLARGSQVVYDLSHVIPASCGNNELVLPPLVVCVTCNKNFGKIEQAFAAEPEFNFKAALLGVPNARTGKPFTHDQFGMAAVLPPRPPGASRAFDATVNLTLHGGTRIEWVPRLTLNAVELPLPTVTTNVTLRWLGLYTRSVQKILFEWYAHHFYVTGQIPERCGAPTENRFDNLRRFVKRGQPMLKPRMILRWYENVSDAMNFHVDVDSDVVLAEMNLLGTHFIAGLAGTNEAVAERLRALASAISSSTMMFAEELQVTGTSGTTVKTMWTSGTASANAEPTPVE